MFCYLFGITSVENPLDATLLSGLRRIAFRDVAALVEDVSSDEFGPAGLERNMASVDWVTRAARRHEAIVSAAMTLGPVIPARLCTIFSDATAVERTLDEEHQRLRSQLSYLGARSEWSLKLYCDAEKLDASVDEADPELAALARAEEGATQGKAYLLRKKRDARRAELRDGITNVAIDCLIEGLETLPVTLRERALIASDLTGRSEPMVLNLAALVGDDDLLAFHAEVKVLAMTLAERGFTLDTSGPWPPYTFASEQGDTDEDADDADDDDADDNADVDDADDETADRAEG